MVLVRVQCADLLFSWYFEPSQPTTKDHIEAKTNFNLSIYSSHKSSNHKFLTQIYIYNKIYTNIKHKIFEESVPSVLPLLKKHRRLGHAGIADHSVDLSVPDIPPPPKKKRMKKEWTVAIINLKMLYKCITANTSAIRQHAAHTTDQLTSPRC